MGDKTPNLIQDQCGIWHLLEEKEPIYSCTETYINGERVEVNGKPILFKDKDARINFFQFLFNRIIGGQRWHKYRL